MIDPNLDPKTLKALKLPIRIEVNVGEGVMLLAMLQLALRHPCFKGESKETGEWGEGFARSLQRAISNRAPHLDVVLESGWKEEFDR